MAGGLSSDLETWLRSSDLDLRAVGDLAQRLCEGGGRVEAADRLVMADMFATCIADYDTAMLGVDREAGRRPGGTDAPYWLPYAAGLGLPAGFCAPGAGGRGRGRVLWGVCFLVVSATLPSARMGVATSLRDWPGFLAALCSLLGSHEEDVVLGCVWVVHCLVSSHTEVALDLLHKDTGLVSAMAMVMRTPGAPWSCKALAGLVLASVGCMWKDVLTPVCGVRVLASVESLVHCRETVDNAWCLPMVHKSCLTLLRDLVQGFGRGLSPSVQARVVGLVQQCTDMDVVECALAALYACMQSWAHLRRAAVDADVGALVVARLRCPRWLARPATTQWALVIAKACVALCKGGGHVALQLQELDFRPLLACKDAAVTATALDVVLSCGLLASVHWLPDLLGLVGHADEAVSGRAVLVLCSSRAWAHEPAILRLLVEAGAVPVLCTAVRTKHRVEKDGSCQQWVVGVCRTLAAIVTEGALDAALGCKEDVCDIVTLLHVAHVS